MNNILILEDNKDIAEIVKELLLENNFKVTVCFNKKDFDKEDLSYYNLLILLMFFMKLENLMIYQLFF